MRNLLGPLALILLWLGLPTASRAGSTCSPANATRTTIESVRGDYKSWSGRCVTLHGLAVGNHLFADREALLEPPQLFGESSRHSILLYDRHRVRQDRKPVLVDVTGIIGSCSDQNAAIRAMQAQNPNEFFMLRGYCHVSLETYIQPASFRIVSHAPVPRLTEAEVPPALRPLAEAPSDLSGQGRYVAAARALAAAMATGDEVAYRRLTNPEVQSDLDRAGGTAPDADLRRSLREIHAEFVKQAEARRRLAALPPPGARQERVFIDRSDLVALKMGRDEISHYLVCWCRTADCEGRWPVLSRDADNNPARPYLCAETNDYVIFRGPNTIQARITEQSEGFAEPAWPRQPPPTG